MNKSDEQFIRQMVRRVANRRRFGADPANLAFAIASLTVAEITDKAERDRLVGLFTLKFGGAVKTAVDIAARAPKPELTKGRRRRDN